MVARLGLFLALESPHTPSLVNSHTRGTWTRKGSGNQVDVEAIHTLDLSQIYRQYHPNCIVVPGNEKGHTMLMLRSRCNAI